MIVPFHNFKGTDSLSVLSGRNQQLVQSKEFHRPPRRHPPSGYQNGAQNR